MSSSSSRNDEPVFKCAGYTLIDNDILKRDDGNINTTTSTITTNDTTTAITTNDNDEEVINEIARYIEKFIIHRFHFISLAVPDDSTSVSTSVLASEDWETNERLLLIVQNANGCKLGIFSRTFCLEKGKYFKALL